MLKIKFNKMEKKNKLEKKILLEFPEQAGYLGKKVIIAPRYRTYSSDREVEAKVIRDDKDINTNSNYRMIFQLSDGKCLFNSEVHYYRLKK